MNASAKEIVFTCGATESDNLAILGVARLFKEKGGHVITAPTEHTRRARLPAGELEREGFAVTYLTPGEDGRDPSRAGRARPITDKTVLVSLMLANNEIGTIQRIAEIGAICREKGVLFHTDAVQGFGKIPFDVEAMNVDLASISGAQDLRPQGRRGALRARPQPARAARADRLRRRPRARHALGHAQRARHRRPRQGRGARRRRGCPRRPRACDGCGARLHDAIVSARRRT